MTYSDHFAYFLEIPNIEQVRFCVFKCQFSEDKTLHDLFLLTEAVHVCV